MTQPLHLKAYAKVNLGLDVLRRREDGYHEVRMIMQTVKLFDYITLQIHADRFVFLRICLTSPSMRRTLSIGPLTRYVLHIIFQTVLMQQLKSTSLLLQEWPAEVPMLPLLW